MATLIARPRLLDPNFAVDPSGPLDVSAVFRLCAAANAPADSPLLGNVLMGTVAALDSVRPFIGQVVADIHDFTEQLRRAARDVIPKDEAERELLMTGRWSRHRVWGLVSGLSTSSPIDVLRIVGAELARSVLLNTTFRETIARKCEQFLKASGKRGIEAETRCRRYANQLILGVNRRAGSTNSPRKKRGALVAARVAASLAAQLNPHNMSDRSAAGTIREMTHVEVKNAMARLLERVAFFGKVGSQESHRMIKPRFGVLVLCWAYRAFRFFCHMFSRDSGTNHLEMRVLMQAPIKLLRKLLRLIRVRIRLGI